MSQPFAEWVQSIKPIRRKPTRWLTETHFHRDPLRATFSDPELVMAPADGTIVHADIVLPNKSLTVHGAECLVPNLIADPDFDEPCLAVGIFLSIYDVHILRAPISGRVSHRDVEPIEPENISMLPAERALIDRRVVPAFDYYLSNERVVSTFRGNGLDVIVVQIADKDVDCVVPFTRGVADYAQSDRFSQIRYGSHAEVLIPLRKGAVVMATQRSGTHVEAGVDSIVRVRRV